MTKDQNTFADGDCISACGADGGTAYGLRRMNVEDRNGELFVVPVVRDGLDDMPLQKWLSSLMYGAVKIDPKEGDIT